ncbi:acylphosphatase [Ureibacillus endophyticus]|uniref:Acylphosphatase n=1 Tax=Ureibacillus endophyticus TaxID=1978490 RepID=A0A494Z6Z8_9BACL|nr:acylphosphatase [Lysinibacillus endophyticus]RKQ18346.1 acylphosphatase [Lysinibacillus endophyticus]
MAKRTHIIFQSNPNETGHRFFIKQKAIALGLKGFCGVNEQKQIEVEVEGKDSSIEEFLKFVQKGFSPSIKICDELKGYVTMESDLL